MFPLLHHGKPFGLKPGLERPVCKPPGVGASLNILRHGGGKCFTEEGLSAKDRPNDST
jgi:hypothetical protein